VAFNFNKVVKDINQEANNDLKKNTFTYKKNSLKPLKSRGEMRVKKLNRFIHEYQKKYLF